MDFGLGLVLSFTDNATAGIGSAIDSLNGLTSVAEESSRSIDQLADVSTLSALSVVAGQLGDTFYSMGSSIMSMFTGILGGTLNTGSQFENLRMTVNALLNDTEKAEVAIQKLMDFAATTPFEISDLTGMFTTITANQLDAFEMLEGATTGIRQELLAFVGDLMAFRPDVPAFQWANAIRNAFSGESRSLRMALDIDLEGMLGRAWGDTPEQIAQDFADLADAIGVAGLMAGSMETWSQVLSNVGDQFTRLFLAIGDVGVFADLKEALTGVTDALFEMSDEDIKGIASVIAESISFLVKPLVMAGKWIGNLIRKFTELSKQNPKLMKFVIQVIAVSGALLSFSGIALKLISSLSGVALVFMAMGGSFGKLKTLLVSGLKTIASRILPLTLLIGGMYLAWKNDFAGIKTLVTDFSRDTSNSFKTARDVVDGSVTDMIRKVKELEASGTFWSNFTLGLTKVMLVFRAIADSWGDNELSEDTFLKAQELGVLPLIEAILDLKYRFGLFLEGFIDGWTRIGKKVIATVKDVTSNVEGTFLEDSLTGITDFFQLLASGDSEAWYEFGNSFADFTARAIVLSLAINLISKALSTIVGILVPIVTFFKGIKTVGEFLVKLMPNLTKPFVEIFSVLIKGEQGVSVFGKLLEVIKAVASGGIRLKDALSIVFGTTATIVGGIMTTVGGAILAVVNFFKMLKNGFNWLNEILMVVGIAIATIGAIILGAPALVAGIIGGIVALVATLVVVIKENWEAIKEFLGGIAEWIYATVIQPIVNFFTTYIFPFIEKIVEIVAKIVEIIVVLVSVFVQWIYDNVITPVANFFKELWGRIVEGVTAFIEIVKEKLAPIIEWISENIIAPIAELFSKLWEGVQIAFEVVADTITSVLKGALNTVFNFIGGIINGVIWGINKAIGVINKIPGVSITKLVELDIPQLAEGGIVTSPTNAIIGEDGAEAVIPLEKNTGWIDVLAYKLGTAVESIVGYTPKAPVQVNRDNYSESNEYLTRDNSVEDNSRGDVDNSIVFEEGALQVIVQSASEEEAERFAKLVIEKIKRMRQLDKMAKYDDRAFA